MAYSVLADIESEFKNLTFSATTNPTDSTVNGFITQADAYIDSKIGLRYAVPVNTTTSPVSAITLKRLSIWLVAARVREIIKVKAADQNVSQGARAGDIGKQARDEIDEISRGTQMLSDAPLVNNTEGMQNFGYSTGETATFDRDSEQW